MADNADDYNNEDEDEELKRLEGNHYETIVAKAAGQGNLEDIQYAHSKKPQSILFEDKNKKFWSPLIWASSKNHVHIVKFLIENGALEPYLKIDEVAHPSKCTLGVINSSVKPTPL